MEPNNINVKPEPLFNNLPTGLIYPISIHNPGNNHLNPSSAVLQDDSLPTSNSICISSVDFSLNDSDKLDNSITVCLASQTKDGFYSESDQSIHNSFCSSTDSNTKPLSIHCVQESSNVFSTQSSLPSLSSEFQVPNLPNECSHKLPVHTAAKPSEALFVRALIGRCKRIAPLWFRGVSSMRERNREENRRMACNSGQSQSDWSLIALKIGEMNAGSETDAISNLLKKLYKELPSDSVFWFLKCWLGSEDTLNDPHSCVISRGDAKGRMRRIDGGKGSDKVWRLDTIVGMLYHGLPMSSTDTNIMVHTCDHELCVRPQHIRFRASSVALVVVLKALAQAGYTIIPPSMPTINSNGIVPKVPDEYVDVFGPFSIEQLQQYRTENLTPASESISKLTLSASDRDLIDLVPVIKDALHRGDSTTMTTSSATTATTSTPITTPASTASTTTGSSMHLNRSNSFHTTTTSTTIATPMTSTIVCSNNLLHPIPVNSFSESIIYSKDTTIINGLSSCKSERYHLKRPRPISPNSLPSSPMKYVYNYHQIASSPPLLISELPSFSTIHNHCSHNAGSISSNSSSGSSSNGSTSSNSHSQIRRPSDSTVLFTNGMNHSSLVLNNPISLTNSHHHHNHHHGSLSAFYTFSTHDQPTTSTLTRSNPCTNVVNNNTNTITATSSNSLLSQSITNGQGHSMAHRHRPRGHHHQQHQHRFDSDQKVRGVEKVEADDEEEEEEEGEVDYDGDGDDSGGDDDNEEEEGNNHSMKNGTFLYSQPYLGLIVNNADPINSRLHIHTTTPTTIPTTIISSSSSTTTTATIAANNTNHTTSILMNHSNYSSSGKSTPRQPAKKRPEARTPTIDGLLDENLLSYPLSNSNIINTFTTSATTTTGTSVAAATVATTGLCNLDDSHLSTMSIISSSTSSSLVDSTTSTFMVHHKSPFVPVHSRIGRPNSTELIPNNLNYMNNNNPNTLSPYSLSLLPTMTPSKEKQSIMNFPVTHHHHHRGDNHAGAASADDDDEGEMDQELVDIMIAHNAAISTSSSSSLSSSFYPTLHKIAQNQAYSLTTTTNNTTHNNNHLHHPRNPIHNRQDLLNYNELDNTSPNGRRVIAAIVAALTSTSDSPLLMENSSSTPMNINNNNNSRRSVSACSLSHFDLNTTFSNDDTMDLFSNQQQSQHPHQGHPHPSHQGHVNFQQNHLKQHHHHNSFNGGCSNKLMFKKSIPGGVGPAAGAGDTGGGDGADDADDDEQPLTPPPPKLLLLSSSSSCSSQKSTTITTATPTTTTTMSSLQNALDTFGDYSHPPRLDMITKLSPSSSIDCTMHNNNDNNDDMDESNFNRKDSSPSESSMLELASLLRNSPASGISQELIDMLANMAQQYGMQQHSRTGSRASRPSSQVAQRFYRSLVNGSVCGSPFPPLTPLGTTAATAAGGGPNTCTFNFLQTPNNCDNINEVVVAATASGGGGGGDVGEGGVIVTCEQTTNMTPAFNYCPASNGLSSNCTTTTTTTATTNNTTHNNTSSSNSTGIMSNTGNNRYPTISMNHHHHHFNFTPLSIDELDYTASSLSTTGCLQLLPTTITTTSFTTTHAADLLYTKSSHTHHQNNNHCINPCAILNDHSTLSQFVPSCSSASSLSSSSMMMSSMNHDRQHPHPHPPSHHNNHNHAFSLHN
ncbi:unnamed protein product [Schistosoma turkestanicum]|nr:unnamed protein product [Schistosoma turkestanicum]